MQASKVDSRVLIEGLISGLNAQPARLKDNWCVPPEQGELMTLLARIHQSRQILEVGTSIGYSGLCFLQALLDTDGHLTTLDASAERQTIAKEHFDKVGCTDRVTLLNGEAIPLLETLIQDRPHSFNMMFLDAKKSEYIDYWRLSSSLLVPGGVLLADNTSSHRLAMKIFIDSIRQDKRWQVVEIPTAHGLMLGRLKP